MMPLSGLVVREGRHRMTRIEQARIEWFERFVHRKLGVELYSGLSDFELRREKIRAFIVSRGIALHTPAAPSDLRSWADIYRAAYGRDLTRTAALPDDPARPGGTA